MAASMNPIPCGLVKNTAYGEDSNSPPETEHKIKTEIKEEVDDLSFNTVFDDGHSDTMDLGQCQKEFFRSPRESAECRETYSSMSDTGTMALLKNGSCKTEEMSDTETKEIKLEIETDEEENASTDNKAANKPYKCLRCNATFATKANRNRHVSVHSSYKAHSCPHCERAYKRKDDLHRHMKIHQHDKPKDVEEELPKSGSFVTGVEQTADSESTSELELEIETIMEEEDKAIDKLYKCLHCDAAFKNKTNQSKHMAVHKIHSCPLCKKAYKAKDELYRHMNSHVPDKNIESTPSSQVNLNSDLPDMNRALPDFSQPTSSESFVDDTIQLLQGNATEKEDQRTVVIQNSMLEDGRYRCPVCKVVFPFLSFLKKHIVSHSKVRSHSCGICKKSFKRKDDLHRHARGHDVSELKMSSEFHSEVTQSLKMKESEQVTENTTSLNKGSGVSATIDPECRSHAEDMLYKCPVCSSMVSFSALQKHIDAHRYVRPHECPLCSEKFRRKYELTKHYKSCANSYEAISSQNNRMALVTHSERNHHKGSVIKKGCTSNDDAVGQQSDGAGMTRNKQNTPKHDEGGGNGIMGEGEVSESCRNTEVVVSSENSSISSVTEEQIIKDYSLSVGEVGDRYYKCSFCKILFPYFSLFKNHILSHSKERPFGCPKCKKRFKRKYDVIRHMATHRKLKKSKSTRFRFEEGLSETDFSRVCIENSMPCSDQAINNPDESTIERGNLIEEYSKIVGNVDDSLFKCFVCDIEFSSESKFVNHVELHSKEGMNEGVIGKEKFKKNEKKKQELRHCQAGQKETMKSNDDGDETCEEMLSLEPDSIDNMDFDHQSNGISHSQMGVSELSTQQYSIFSSKASGRPYKCSVCFRAFRSKGSCKKHMVVHSTEKPFKCSMCNKRFKRKDDMMKHRSGHFESGWDKDGGNDVDAIPKTSDKAANDKELRIQIGDLCHLGKADSRKASTNSSLCSSQRSKRLETFERNQNCGDHDDQMSSSKREYDLVGQSSTDLNVFTDVERKRVEGLALKSSHIMIENEQLEMNPSLHEWLRLNDQGNDTGENRALFPCSVCNKTYIRESDLTKHHRKMHNIFENRDEGSHPCDLCGMTFKLKGNLKRHMTKHSNEKPFACTVCPKAFKRKDDCEKHEHIHLLHKVTCTVCGKTFTDKARLEHHLKSHENRKSIQCSICHKVWRKQSELVCHMRVHTNERPFECNLCGKSFKTSSGLKMHSHRHKGEKTFNCDFCSQAFFSRGELMRHVNIHTREKSYVCHLCGKAFTLPTTLKRHLQIHAGLKPHKCSTCPKRFTTSYQLQAHTKSHMGLKPHKCDICGKAFSERRTLENHKLRHLRET